MSFFSCAGLISAGTQLLPLAKILRPLSCSVIGGLAQLLSSPSICSNHTFSFVTNCERRKPMRLLCVSVTAPPDRKRSDTV